MRKGGIVVGLAEWFQLMGSVFIVALVFIVLLVVLIGKRKYKFIFAEILVCLLVVAFLVPFFTNISFRSSVCPDRYFESRDSKCKVPLPPNSYHQMTLQYGFNYYSKSDYKKCIEFYDYELPKLKENKQIIGYKKISKSTYEIYYDKFHTFDVNILDSLWAFSVQVKPLE